MSPNPYRYKYPLLASKKSYEAVAVEHENRIDTIIVAAELPYYLIRDPYASSDPFAFREWTLERSYSTLEIPTLTGPMLQVYTSLDLLVTDLTGDGREDVILSDKAEQNRLWYFVYSDPPYRWLNPLWDLTSAYFPAGGQYSTRVLMGDLYEETPWPDLVVAINWVSPPNIYMNHRNPGTGAFSLINWNIVFPEDEWKNTALGGAEQGGGGWDGALVDLNSDNKLDLVLAQGIVDAEYANYNAVYLWNSSVGQYGQFKRNVDALPEDWTGLYVTRGMAAGKLNDDSCTDLVFAETIPRYPDIWPWFMKPGLKLYLNEVENPGPGETCKAEFGAGVWLDQGIAFRAVALIEYEGGRLPDIIAGDATTI